MSSKTLLFACIVLAILLRLNSLSTLLPNADEPHWVTRSSLVNDQIRNRNWEYATTHLGHPGIPAALAMAAAQRLGNRWNIDKLTSSRAIIILISCLIFPLIHYLGRTWFEPATLVLAVFLLSFDCLFTSLSRIAHIDSVLTLLSVLCVLTYFHAQEKDSLQLKLLAGVFWGLAIVTKPTAISLIGIFLIFNTLRRILLSSSRQTVVSWSDIGALAVGQITICALYTKLWNANNGYITKHHLNPKLGQFLENLGETFRASSSSLVLVVLLLGISVYLIYKEKFGSEQIDRFSFHLRRIGLTISAFFLFLATFPLVANNVVRFWTWVLKLSKRPHDAYGINWKPPSFGYTEIFFRRLPLVMFIGIVLALFFLVPLIKKYQNSETVVLLCVLFLAPFIWTAPLSMSPKQTMRYIAPMFPFAYMLCAWGYEQLAKKIRLTPKHLGFFFMLPIGGQIMTYSYWSPHHELQFNPISGGIVAAADRGWTLSPVGYKDALLIFQNESIISGKKQKVEIIGDIDLMNYAYSHLLPADQRFVQFVNFHNGITGDWLLDFETFTARGNVNVSGNPRYKKIYEYKFRGATIYSVYKIEPPDFINPETVDIQLGNRNTGRISRLGRGTPILVAEPNTDAKGYILFNLSTVVGPGTYTVSYPIAAFAKDNLLPDIKDPESAVFKLQFSSKCIREIKQSELNFLDLRNFELSCSFKKPFRANHTVYWNGNFPVKISNPVLVRVSDEVH